LPLGEVEIFDMSCTVSGTLYVLTVLRAEFLPAIMPNKKQVRLVAMPIAINARVTVSIVNSCFMVIYNIDTLTKS
jgi:hypothetical protein